MDYLWTPWRSTYMNRKDEDTGCVFCRAASDPAHDPETLVVYRGVHCFVILNRYPYTSGHLMIVPYFHANRLAQLSAAASDELIHLGRRAEVVLESVYRPDGLNLGINLGAAAGAGIAQHLHMHALPRWTGDANFMTTIGDTRIIPEALTDSYARVKNAFDAAET